MSYELPVVGDKGIVYSAGAPYSQFNPVDASAVGDRVILIPIGNDQQLAVPVLEFSLNMPTWVIPDFRFAGFDWKFDWSLQMLGLNRMKGYFNRLLVAGFWNEYGNPSSFVIWEGDINYDGIHPIYIGGSAKGGDTVPPDAGAYGPFMLRYGRATSLPYELLVDDGLIIATEHGSISFPTWGFMTPQEVSTIFHAGANHTTITLTTDQYSDGVGGVYLWTAVP